MQVADSRTRARASALGANHHNAVKTPDTDFWAVRIWLARGPPPSAGWDPSSSVMPRSLCSCCSRPRHLSVYKPWGLTRYGQRAQQQVEASEGGPSLRLKIALAVIGLIVAAFVPLHLAGHGLRHGM
jgi:hypothetical protein